MVDHLSAGLARSEDIYVGFTEWTGHRTPVVLGTNAGAEPIAFQNWRKVKEAFAPEVVARALEESSAVLGRPVTSCIDPFAGSGTTLLASQFLGVDPIGIEVNPFLADLAEAKLTAVDPARVAASLMEVLSTARDVDPHQYYANGPATFVEPGVKGRYLFTAAVASRLAGLLDAILRLREPAERRLLRVLLGTAALEVCNALVSGKGRRYRRNWQQRTFGPEDLDREFERAVEAAVFDAVRYGRRRSMAFQLHRGDAREMVKTIERADVAVFSPPYPNSFDYTDVYNIELWALGYLHSVDDNWKLRRATLRSHVQIKRDMSSAELSPVIADAVDALRARPTLWNRAIPDMIGAYFHDLRGILSELRRVLPVSGRVYMVVGDSRYSGVDIPVAAGITALAPAVGYAVIASEPFRSMRASPQQGGRLELNETLITLQSA